MQLNTVLLVGRAGHRPAGRNEVRGLMMDSDYNRIYSKGYAAGKKFSAAEVERLLEYIDDLKAEIEQLEDIKERIIDEARCWKFEARCHRRIVQDIYQLIGSNAGTWNGARPVAEYIANNTPNQQEHL